MGIKLVTLFAILFIASFLRFWQLGIVPVGVTHDELGYIYNSYSIAKTGKNVFGEFLPFLTWVNKIGWPFLPVPIYFSIPFFWLFELSATVGRLPSAVLGVMDVLLLYILVKQIFNKTGLALLAAFFLAISPWHLHFSRSAYDPNFALFFYLLGIVIFVFEIKRGRMPIFSPISFGLAIFSYRGMSVIFLPLIVILAWYGITVLRAKRKQVIIFFLGVSFVVASLLFVVITNGNKYIADASIVDEAKMQEEIDTQIRDAQGPLLLRRLFLNKPMYIANKLRENYVRAYSPEFLFLYTEPSKIYSIWSRGRIYFLDLPFIILGIAYLYKINKSAASFTALLVLIGGLPGMIGGFPYSARNFFLSVFFPVLSAGGVLFLLQNVVIKQLKIIVIGVLATSYAYILGSYVFDYYGRYAFYAGEAWAKSIKDISEVVNKNRQYYKKIIVGNTSFGDFIQYAFYAKIDPRAVQNTWKNRKKGSNESFSYQNVTYTIACFEGKQKGEVMYIVHEGCNKFATPSALIKDYFGNTVWKIYNLRSL